MEGAEETRRNLLLSGSDNVYPRRLTPPVPHLCAHRLNRANEAMIKLLFAGTIFSSAFLLFLVQPLVSKNILPWFGGSAAVWATCMVFFQVVLLLGYAYSDWISRHLHPRWQVILHVSLLVLSLVTLSVLADASWKPRGSEDPALRIVGLLAATIGLPYFLLSTTGPLIQTWVARTLGGTKVYRFFSLSNLASLVALICYPFVLEPRATLLLQAQAWSGVYMLFAFLCAGCGLYFASHPHGSSQSASHRQAEMSDTRPRPRDYFLWLALSAMGSWLLLAITNHITQNIASVPFLWILPLTIYLLTFVLCFESDRWYARSVFLLPTAAVLAVCAYGLQDRDLGVNIRIAIPVYAMGLFLCCMFLHGELAQLRPAPRYLTRFYLMVSLGGALGGIAVGLIAPRVLPAYYELGMGFVIVGLLAAYLLKGRSMAIAAACLTAVCAYFLFIQISSDLESARRVERSFYGSLRTADSHFEDPEGDVRELFHGAIRHGEQYLAPQRRSEPTTYYGPNSGIGLAIGQARASAKRVGLIGLGAGTLATYGRPGDAFRFYEINPQVIEIARNEFTFLADCRADVEIVQGDARLALEKEPPQGFDVLAVDAFSGDAIPVHLLTREAMAVYLRHMKPDGIIAFHVTNRFLALAPVIKQLAASEGLHAVLIKDEAEESGLNRTDWVLVTRTRQVLQNEEISSVATPIREIGSLGVWTDDFNNLFDVLK